ncbi:MAG: riboflavin synthase subunit alpha [Gemmatimonadetes bacterium GWC2_71_10]|nr:MAG: riboflavin synthase subunit alpha [Gemmatimonadetes bacterium GWC2_71_10]
MFTGIVTAMGTVRAVRRSAGGLSLTIAAPYRGLAVGESVAVDGVCLTVVRKARGTVTVDIVAATVDKTMMGDYQPGRRVNLERALRAADRMGGHIVQGHVDGVGEVVAARPREGSLELDIRMPAEVARVTVPRGSLAVDGVSMTVSRLPRRGVARIAVIPHTQQMTTLGRARPGTRVHLEADVIGKLVAQLVAPHRATRRTER